MEAGNACEESCNDDRQSCLEPCLSPVFDNECLDACTASHLQCMRTCPCVTVGDCAFGCPCPGFSCDPVCDDDDDIDRAQENELNHSIVNNHGTAWCWNARSENFLSLKL